MRGGEPTVRPSASTDPYAPDGTPVRSSRPGPANRTQGVRRHVATRQRVGPTTWLNQLYGPEPMATSPRSHPPDRDNPRPTLTSDSSLACGRAATCSMNFTSYTKCIKGDGRALSPGPGTNLPQGATHHDCIDLLPFQGVAPGSGAPEPPAPIAPPRPHSTPLHDPRVATLPSHTPPPPQLSHTAPPPAPCSAPGTPPPTPRRTAGPTPQPRTRPPRPYGAPPGAHSRQLMTHHLARHTVDSQHLDPSDGSGQRTSTVPLPRPTVSTWQPLAADTGNERRHDGSGRRRHGDHPRQNSA